MRTSLIRGALTLTFIVLLSAPALAQGVEIFPGQKLTGSFDEPSDNRIFRFQAVQGDLLTLKVSVPKKSDLEPVVDLLGPAGRIDLPAPAKNRITLKKAPLPATGTYFLFVAAAGTTGDFQIAMKLKGAKVPTTTISVPGNFSFDAPRGATLKATVKAAKGTDLEPGIDALTGPLGKDHLDPLLLREKGRSAKISKQPIVTFGEQTMALAARAGAGGATVKLRIKPARPLEKKLTPGMLVETTLLKVRTPEDGGGFEYALLVEVEGDDVTAATLVHPDGTETNIPRNEPGDFELDIETDDEVDVPDGLYRLVVSRTGGITREYPIVIGGPWPTPVEVTAVGAGATPTITWTGGVGAQAVFLAIADIIDDDEAYETLLPVGTTSHTVPAGPLTAGRPYEIEVVAISSGHKVAVGGEVSGSTELEVSGVEGMLVYAATGDWRPTDFYTLEAAVEGAGIREVTLEFPSGRAEKMWNDEGTWRFRSVSGRPADFEEGTYTFAIEPIEGSTDRSYTFPVGGGMPDWSQGGAMPDPGLFPGHLSGTGTATPKIRWPGLNWANGYRIDILDKDDEVVHRATVASPSATNYDVPAGVLDADRWYTAFVSASSSQGKIATLYATFYTGSGLTSLGFDVIKARGRIGDAGSTLYFAESCVWADGSPDLGLTGVRLIGVDHSTVIDLKKDGDEYCFESALLDSEGELGTTLPDGFWRLEVTFANGSVCRGIFTWVGGGWPDWISIASPVDESTGVTRTPGLTWSYGDLTNLLSVGASLFDDGGDEDYVYMWDREPTITTIPWAGFDEREVSQLPAGKWIDMEVFGSNGHNKQTTTVGRFKTEN